MIKEVLVVEGKMDVVAIGKAVEADCIITGGFSLKPKTLDDIEKAYKRRGIIILTDPDSAGERIRKFLAKRFPDDDQEDEYVINPAHESDKPAKRMSMLSAAVEDLRTGEPTQTLKDVIFSAVVGAGVVSGISGGADASKRRAALGAALGLGFANAKTFLKRLNHYGVTRAEFQEALAALEKGENA